MKWCVVCHQRRATLALQHFFTNCGVPVNERSVEVLARPHVCDECVSNLVKTFIVVNSYQECRDLILLVAGDKSLHNTTLFYRSAKYQPRQGDL